MSTTATEVNGQLVLKDEKGNIVAQLNFLGMLQIAVPAPPDPGPDVDPDAGQGVHNYAHNPAHN